MSSRIPSDKLTAIKIAGLYAVVGGLWILFSDTLTAQLFSDIRTLLIINTFKGWFFVGTTSWLLYLFIRRDIGLIERSEKALKESVSRLEDEKAKSGDIMAAIGDGICIVDTNFNILYQNQAHQNFLGNHIGKYCYKAYGGTDTVCEGCPVDMIFRDGEPRVVERSVAAGDEVKYFETAAYPLRNAERGITAAIEVLREITSRKKIERDLLRTKKLESIGILARGMSHDFNNVLTGILGNISLAKMSLRPEDPLITLLTRAENACLRGERLTNQLHTVAKSSESEKKTIPIGGLIKESSGFALNGSAVTCTYHLADELRPVIADEKQISQAIYNIVANAREAMHGNGHIKINAENAAVGNSQTLRQGNYVKITIEDEGPGIEEDLLPKIFDPYYTTKELDSNTGTGLSLAAGYFAVKNHNGYIFAESTVGEGTSFCIYLPSA
ncbi:MAG: PAS domain-containing protein [Nitrospirae bacterium]|nr:PAS domain-containing protein [Nitrospirota bacterium]